MKLVGELGGYAITRLSYSSAKPTLVKYYQLLEFTTYFFSNSLTMCF